MVNSAQVLMPLPAIHRERHCCLCDKPQASWQVRLPLPSPVSLCSLCVLYDTPWGERSAPKVKHFMDQISQLRPLEQVDGRLVTRKDADDVLGAVVLYERTEGRMR